MKRFLCLLAVLCLMGGAPALGEALRVQGIAQTTFDSSVMQKVESRWYAEYTRAHPEVALRVNPKWPYKTTKSMMNALQTGKLNADVFTLWVHVHNMERFMEEGYCADLSGNETLMAVIDQLYPTVAKAVTRNGAVYGMPIGISAMDYLSYTPEALDALGLSESDLPTSFTGLLDFLEAWPERFATRPMVSVNAYWDAEHCDNEHVYTQWLVGLLVRHYARQCEYQGKPVDFTTPQFLALLNRSKTVGDALYGHDGLQEPNFLFCEMIGSAGDVTHAIPMRMTDDDPIFYAMELTCLCVSAKGDRQALGEALIASYMQTLLSEKDSAEIDTEEGLDYLSAQEGLFATVDRPMRVSNSGALNEKSLDLYRRLTESFYFPMPGAFDSRAGGTNDIRLRFARGQLSAEKYVKQLQTFVN